MNIKDLKQGQPFSAILSGIHVKGHAVYDGEYLQLCQNTVEGHNGGIKLIEGDYKYSYAFALDEKGNIPNASLYKLKFLKGPCLGPIKPSSTIAGYSFRKKGDKVLFGCGEVSFTLAQIKAFLDIRDALERRGRTENISRSEEQALKDIVAWKRKNI